MARPKNEDLPVTVRVTCGMLPANTLPSIERAVFRNEEITVTRKEADALELFRFAEIVGE